MKSLHLVLSIVAFSFGLFAAVAANGQLDHRVNRGNTATGGRALDKNPGLGSSRFNLTRPGMSDPGAASNAIITGNVTGLGGFKDNSPVSQSNQFRDSLPSAGLSGFQSRSVGLPEVSSNRAIAPTYYFGQSETITNAGQITQGLNAPGSSMLAAPNTAPPAVRSPNGSSQELSTLIRQPEDRRVGISSVVPRAGFSQRTVIPATAGRTDRDTISPYGSAMGSSIFGTPLPTPGSAGFPSNRKPLVSEVNLPWANRTIPFEPDESADTDGLVGVNPRIRQQAVQDLPPETKTENPAGLSQQLIGEPTQSPNTPPTPIPTPDNLGADRFADLYNAVELAQRFGARDMGFNIGASSELEAQPGAADEANRAAGGKKELIRRPSEGLNQLASAAKWAKDVVDDPLRSFAGKYPDRLNQYMVAGEADLRAGRFYSAARQFDLAATVDPLNPLPLLARGHAFIAAGDYVSAVHSIEQGIQRFPQIAAFRIDLPSLVGQHDIFDIRRADLESKLANSANVELRFLLGYIELYSGLPEEGLKNLERAAKDAPPAGMIAIFGDLVSGRRDLPAVGR